MEYSFSVNMYDDEGDAFDTCVIAHIGPSTMVRFENVTELEQFAKKITASIPELRGSYPNA